MAKLNPDKQTGVLKDQVNYDLATLSEVQNFMVKNYLKDVNNFHKNRIAENNSLLANDGLSGDRVAELKHQIEVSRALCDRAYQYVLDKDGIDINKFNKVAPPACLHGQPGEGKTESAYAAAHTICDVLGMKFVKNPGKTTVIGDYDFVFVIQDVAGEVSNMKLSGVVKVSENTEGESGTESALPHQFLKMAQANASMFILDDLPNATAGVIATAYAILQDKRVGTESLGNPCVVVTGNIAGLDGTGRNTAEMNKAITSRCTNFLTENLYSEWKAYTLSSLTDEVGDAGICAFLETHHENLFTVKQGDPKYKNGAAPNARNWSFLTGELRDLVSSPKNNLNLDQVEKVAKRYVGSEAAAALKTYVYAMATGAMPVARELMESGEIPARFYQLYTGTGAQSESFAHQFSAALAQVAVSELNKESVNKSEVLLKALKGILAMDASRANQAAAELGKRIQSLPADKQPGAGEIHGINLQLQQAVLANGLAIHETINLKDIASCIITGAQPKKGREAVAMPTPSNA